MTTFYKNLTNRAIPPIFFWRDVLRAGASLGVRPIGLAARDSLRIEARSADRRIAPRQVRTRRIGSAVGF